jgi:hypothetical protein
MNKNIILKCNFGIDSKYVNWILLARIGLQCWNFIEAVVNI